MNALSNIFTLLVSSAVTVIVLIGHYERLDQPHLPFNPRSGKIAFVGDSITFRGDWDRLLPEVEVLNYGVGSDYTDSVLARVGDVVRAKPKVVYLMVGINDIYAGDHPAEIAVRYKAIIERLSPHTEVVIQSTLFPGREEDVGQRRTVEVLNGHLKRYASQNDLQFIDLNRKMSPGGVLLGEYTSDGIHLSHEGYIVWAKALKEYLGQNKDILASN